MSINDSKDKTEQTSIKSVEDLLFFTISGFSDITIDNFNKKVEVIFSTVGTFLNLNRISIVKYNLANQTINKTHEWCNQNVSSKIEYIKDVSIPELNGDFFKYHLNNQAYVIEDISMIKDNHILFQAVKAQDIVSFASEPIIIKDHYYGYISFEEVVQDRHWNTSERNILKVLAVLIKQIYAGFSVKEQMDELENKMIEKNKSQGEYLYKMSHDIRTPLGGIYNAIYLLESTNLSVEQKDYLEIGQASIDVMSSIVDGILDLSKVETGNMEVYNDSFNLEDELIRVYKTHKPIADEKGLNFDIDYDYRINQTVVGDYRKLRQIMHNLISNSIKYTHEGFIRITTNLVIEEQKSMIEFEIIDSGIGLDENEIVHLNRIFEQNQERGFNRFQSSGLGLPVSFELVQLMGGTMTIKSEPHVGSTFKVSLPFELAQPYTYTFSKDYLALIISDKKALIAKDLLESMGIKTFTLETIKDEKCDLIFFESEIKEEELILNLKMKNGNDYTCVISIYQGEQKKLNTINLYVDFPISRHNLHQKIINTMSSSSWQMNDDFSSLSILNGYALIVDDNRLNRIALESILTKEGMRSKSVSSGLKAIEAIKNESFDLVFMDVQMPDMDGMETTRRIRNLGKIYESLPIIAVTANAFLNDYDFLKTSLMNDIIFKPIRVKNLNLILRKYVKATSTIQIPEELFVFDQKDFETRFEGSFDIADEVIASFLIEYKKDLKHIKKAIEEKNAVQIVEATHYFKGSCSYLSGKRAVWLLSFMIDAAKRQSLEMMDMCFDLLEKEVAKLLETVVDFKK